MSDAFPPFRFFRSLAGLATLAAVLGALAWASAAAPGASTPGPAATGAAKAAPAPPGQTPEQAVRPPAWSRRAGNPLDKVTFKQHLKAQLPLNARFTDEQGKTVRLGRYFHDRPVILELGYYNCPQLCPMVTDGMVKALKKISLKPGRDYQVLMISINPKEGPADARAKKRTALAKYGDLHAGDAFHFLTGKKPAIHAVTDTAGFKYTYLPKSNTYAHKAGIIIITPQGKISKYFFNLSYSPQSVRLSLVQASNGGIGSLVDELILSCCVYNPKTGTYGPTINTILLIAGMFTILVIVGGVTLAWILEWRRRRTATAVSPPSGETSRNVGKAAQP